jgi:mono/diheme cytochrome c family protein/preprotein translocase subunit SecG
MMAFTKTITKWLPLLGMLYLFSWQVAFAQDPKPADGGGASALGDATAGQALYEANCVSCHSPGADVVVGPGLKGILERRSIEWLIPWVKNSQAVIASGDKYAVDLFNKYNKAVMTSFAFSDAEIKNIFAYVQAYKEPVKGGGGGEKKEGEPATSSSDGGSFNILLTVLLFVLALIFTVLILLLSVINRFLKQKTDLNEADVELINQKFEPLKVFQSRPFIMGVTLIFGLVFLKSVLDGMVDIGIQQGYAPTQPIAFSHKLHAGQYQIDCAYCHTGVYKGKSATIPSASTCMNCHNQIKRGSPEIQKIYAAIEKNRPIEWVRIHNLPDLAYFNHAQHTNVAGLDCAKCHGEIAEMEVVQQRAPLTMGWCINCHRETVVEHANNNAYYDKLLAYHQKQGIKKMTVENIGGLECAKCHY